MQATESESLPFPAGISAGMKFNRLTLISRTANDRNGRVMILVRCDCPEQTELTVRLSDLKGGENAHTTSCGCSRVDAIKKRYPKVRFRLMGCYVAIGRNLQKPMSAKSEWVAGCSFCGSCKSITTSQLRTHNRRCPCLKETYNSWRNMIQRCTNPKHDQYSDYGGRGIRIDEEWKKFAGFLWHMGKRPEGTTLDRINVNGDYTARNCRWSTPEEQAQNRRPARWD